MHCLTFRHVIQIRLLHVSVSFVNLEETKKTHCMSIKITMWQIYILSYIKQRSKWLDAVLLEHYSITKIVTDFLKKKVVLSSDFFECT